MPKPNKSNKSKKNADNQSGQTKQHSSNDSKGEKSKKGKKDEKGKKNKDTARSFVESAENNTISDKRINSGYKYVSNAGLNTLGFESLDKSKNYR